MADELNCAAPIAAQLDQDADRAKFEAWSKRTAPAYGFDKDERGQYVAYPVHVGWAAWQAARSTAPAVAQLDAELPPPSLLFAPDVYGYTPKDVRQIVAPYAERIRLLTDEREADGSLVEYLREQLQQTTDALARVSMQLNADRQATLEAANAWVYECLQPGGEGIWCEFFSRTAPDSADFIRNVRGLAYIDGRTAGTAPEQEVEYELYEVVGHDRLMVAGTSGKGAYEEILSYAAQYVQDGPVELCKIVRTKLSIPGAAPSPQENTNEN